jgi:hypothetical protein
MRIIHLAIGAIVVFAILSFFTACTSGPVVPVYDKPKPPTTTTTTTMPPKAQVPDVVAPRLSWEKYPENRAWSEFMFKIIFTEFFDKMDKAQDIERFCPKYRSLDKYRKTWVLGEMISAISKYESGWNPLSRMQETTMGIDPVTKEPVYSEGLLQLSYQDIQWAPYCAFDWSKDKALSRTSPAKTILDPYKNLYCGTRILANQIASKGKIILSSGVYWAVIKEGGKYQKIDPITSYTKALPFCN